MYIDGKNYELSAEVYEMLENNWRDNINQFKSQNTAILINNIEDLSEEMIIKFIDTTYGKYVKSDLYIDKKFILSVYSGLTVNPQVFELSINNTIQCDLRPDISFVNMTVKE